MKITTCLILILLLVTNLASAFGFVYCDSGCLSEIHHKNHHIDESHEAIGEDHAVAFDQQLQESGDSCLDYLLQLSNGIIKKNVVKSPANAAPSLPSARLTDLAYICLSVDNPYPESPLRISQTILAHRTVVLLR